MKVKQLPEDFIVEELTDAVGGETGEFGFYKLEKTGWTTPDALAAIRRRWQIEPRRISYGGLKDRHAKTTQYLSIWHGPQRNLSHERINLTFLGRIIAPYASTDIRANRFSITIRSLTETTSLQAALTETQSCGVPNYFDDQRFGSVTQGGRFIALEMVKGHFEESLKLALSAPYEHDRSEEKKVKAILRAYWSDWSKCKTKLPRSHARSIVDYLMHHPTDFKGAIARLQPELGNLYLSAYQSHVWNRMLSHWLASNLPVESLMGLELRMGSHFAPRTMPDALRRQWETLAVPLPSSRWKPDPAHPWRNIAEEVLREDNITLESMCIKGLEKPYFSKGERAACLIPANLQFDSGPDELQKGRSKARLRFELPRGCYATMVIKRLTAEARM